MIIFCVGLELYNAGISEKHYIYYMLVYSMMSPIGIAIGITVDVGLEHHHEEAYKSIVGLLQVSMIIFSINILSYSSSFSFPIFHCYWYASLIQALAGGNLLYLAVFEILQREKCKEKVPGMLQLMCVIIGFLVIMCLDITGYDDISFLGMVIEILDYITLL